MKGLENFEHWARAARTEGAPLPDVTTAVMRRLAEDIPLPTPEIWGLAAASACAAVLCAVWGYNSWLSLLGDCYGWLADFAQWSVL